MWIKICGIRDAESAVLAARCGAHAIGLNFYARSPRSVDVERAQQIARSLPADVEAVGLFVNHSVDDVVATISACGLRSIQLHGDETPADIAAIRGRLPDVRVLRAFRVGNEGLSAVGDSLAQCKALGARLDACLIDARADGAYGGTGRLAPWEIIAREYRQDEWPPLILAGGLTCENVAEAIAVVRPWGVDTASGVESEPGRKDPKLIEKFVAAARAAFEK